MKKCCVLLCCTLLLFSSIAVPASAAEAPANEDVPVVTDVEVTEEDLAQWETVPGINNFNNEKLRATNLITDGEIFLAKSGGKLIISGHTGGIPDVGKVGFTYVKLQRLVNGTWQDYLTWSDLYSSSTAYTLGKSVSAASGYTYRVTCEHYAEKTTFLFFKSTERIPNQTSTLYF